MGRKKAVKGIKGYIPAAGLLTLQLLYAGCQIHIHYRPQQSLLSASLRRRRLHFYLMGPSRKRPRTKPPNVDESGGQASPAEPSTKVAESSSKVPNTNDNASIPLKSPVNEIKSGGSAKDVSIVYNLIRQTTRVARR